jgi:hypothetical protein
MPKVEAKDHRRRMHQLSSTGVALRRHVGIEMVYHVFTDGKDEWTKKRETANRLFRRFARTYGTARLYEERYSDRANDVMESEKCLRSYGAYPM